MTHFMKLDPGPFDMIRTGAKTIELRLYDEKRRQLQVGDVIEFTDAGDGSRRIRATVTALHRFPSFAALYESLPLLRCGYTEQTVASASPEDMRAYYSAEQEARYGVVGIELSVENFE